MLPESAVSNPSSTLMSVDLPQPLGPISVIICPASSLMLMLSSTVLWLRCSVRPDACNSMNLTLAARAEAHQLSGLLLHFNAQHGFHLSTDLINLAGV